MYVILCFRVISGFLDRSFPKEAIIVRIYYTGDSCMNLGCVDKSVPKRGKLHLLH